ncbi:MAG TPA: Ig-like domain-containing protein, partial [Gemmatales bacterium]|nr:Ig-like domain-containing protein [Gemmatales bacterium]
ITTTAGLNTSDYTNDFGGTSSATPLVSGVIALMLEARPDLTARDVQYILVNSSRQVDAADPGWFQNNGGSGFWYNDKYGFGMIDADAAVNTALAWTKVRPQINATSGLITTNLAIPDADPVGVTASYNYAGTDMPLEHVELVINVTHTWRGDLKFILTSPNGTQSVMDSRNGDSTDNFVNWKFTSVANWGESPLGTWTLNVVDTAGLDIGTLNSFQLNFFGEGPPVPPTANADFYTMQEDGVLFVPTPGVLGNDLFASTAQLVTSVGVGNLNFNPSGSFVYVPPANYFGTVTFTYQAINQDGISLPATVTITVNSVNDLPVANNDGVYVARPGYNFTLNAPGVLANDTDVDSPPSSLVATLYTSTFRGNISLNPNGSFTYLAANGTGVDNFQYRVSDGIGSSAPATVTIQLNSPPVVQSANVYTEVGVAASGNVLTGATDLDGNSFTAALVTGPANGSLVLNSNGTYTYTPNAGFFGIDTFQFRANDLYYNVTPDQVGNTGTITIRVNRKPVTAGDSYNGKQGDVMEIFSPGILANDSDLDTPLFGDVVRANLVS